MLLIISLCPVRLHELEFVKPIKDLLKKANFKSFTKPYHKIKSEDLNKAKKIIICGTALKDFDYLKNTDKFRWLTRTKKPVLGICGGMQVIATLFNNKLVKNTLIGQFTVRLTQKNRLISKEEFGSYFLNSKAVKFNKPFKILARSGRLACLIKHQNKEIYGCLFHPEVLNEEIILNFLKL